MDEITAKLQGRDEMEHDRNFPAFVEKCMENNLTLNSEKVQQKQFQGKTSEQCCSAHGISPDSWKSTVLSHAEFPPDMESMPFSPENQFLQEKQKSTLRTKLKPLMDTCTFTLTFTLGTDQQPLVDIDQKPFTNS